MRQIISFSAIAILAMPALGDVVTERWGADSPCRHAATVTYLSPATGGVVAKFDLSALPKEARIIRARFLPHIDIDGVPLPERVDIRTLAAPADEKSAPIPVGRPLELVGPRFMSFDATEAVRQWASGKLADHGLWVRGRSFDRRRTCLEITYEGKLDRMG